MKLNLVGLCIIALLVISLVALGIGGCAQLGPPPEAEIQPLGLTHFSGVSITGGLFLPGFADETITDGETLTPTVTVYALDSASAVTMTLAASASEGQPLVLIGDDNNTITINTTNLRTTDGNAVTVGQYDVVMFVYQDSEWLHIAKSANQ
jgi:hypothetical protein